MFDFDKPKIPPFFKLWFAFVALCVAAVMGGAAFIGQHFIAKFW